MIKFKATFETIIEIECDDYDDAHRLATLEAEGMTRVLYANTNYNKFRLKNVRLDLENENKKLEAKKDEFLNSIKVITNEYKTNHT